MKYVTLLPFMDSEELKDLAEKIISQEVKGVNIVTLYPFLDRSSLDEIVEKLIEAKDGRKLRSALPFVSRETVEKIYQGVKDGSITGINEHSLLPFLGRKAIKDMFYDLIKDLPETDFDKDEDFFDDDEEDEN